MRSQACHLARRILPGGSNEVVQIYLVWSLGYFGLIRLDRIHVLLSRFIPGVEGTVVTDVTVSESSKILITIFSVDLVKLIKYALLDEDLLFDFLGGVLSNSYSQVYSSSQRPKVAIEAFLTANGVGWIEHIHRLHVHLVSVNGDLVNKRHFNGLVNLQVG